MVDIPNKVKLGIAICVLIVGFSFLIAGGVKLNNCLSANHLSYVAQAEDAIKLGKDRLQLANFGIRVTEGVKDFDFLTGSAVYNFTFGPSHGNKTAISVPYNYQFRAINKDDGFPLNVSISRIGGTTTVVKLDSVIKSKTKQDSIPIRCASTTDCTQSFIASTCTNDYVDASYQTVNGAPNTCAAGAVCGTCTFTAHLMSACYTLDPPEGDFYKKDSLNSKWSDATTWRKCPFDPLGLWKTSTWSGKKDVVSKQTTINVTIFNAHSPIVEIANIVAPKNDGILPDAQSHTLKVCAYKGSGSALVVFGVFFFLGGIAATMYYGKHTREEDYNSVPSAWKGGAGNVNSQY